MKTLLAVDLDGTLVNTDLFFESAIWYIRKSPLRFFQMCWWFFTKGRAELKIQIEKRVALPVSDLPFNQNVIQWLRSEKKKEKELVLVTGASQKYAEQISKHLGLFSQVFGVCRERPRLTGRNKARFLIKLYGEKNFDYIGNSVIDLAVWEKAGKCIVANAFPFVIQLVQKRFSQVQILSESSSVVKDWNLFKKFFSLLILRICVWFIPVFSSGWPGSWNDFISSFVLALPVVVLLYGVAFLLGELQDLGPHRILQQKGIFVSVHPYWGLLSIPLMIVTLFYLCMVYDLLIFSVWWFLIYFVLEYMRWTVRKHSFYYDMALTCILWVWGFISFH